MSPVPEDFGRKVAVEPMKYTDGMKKPNIPKIFILQKLHVTPTPARDNGPEALSQPNPIRLCLLAFNFNHLHIASI